MRSRLSSCVLLVGIWPAVAQNPRPPYALSGACMELNQKIVGKVANGQLPGAETALSAALTSKEGGESSCLWLILHNMANVMALHGRLVEAEAIAKRSLGIMDALFAPDDPARLRPLHLLWSVQLQQEKRGSARQTYRSMQSLRLDDTQNQATLYSAAAAQSEVEGHPKEAEVQYARAVAAWIESGRGETTDVASLLVALGKLQASQGRYLEAGKSLDRALTIVQSAKDAVPMDLINLLRIRATLYAREGKWQAAAEDQGSAMSMADRDARLDPGQRKLMLVNFAHILRRAHRAPEARSMEARARAIHTPESTNAVVDFSEMVDNVKARGK